LILRLRVFDGEETACLDRHRSSWIEDNGKNKDPRENNCQEIEKDRKRNSAKGMQHRAITRVPESFLIPLRCRSVPSRIGDAW
jgi:hypothetical protein